MDIIFVLAVFCIDIIIHYFTIQSWGWLDSILVNLMLMLLGWLLYQWRKSSIDWQTWAKSQNSISKKKLKIIDHQFKHNPEKVSNKDKAIISMNICIVLISIGYVLVLLPGLFTGTLGLIMMVIGFVFVNKYQQTK